MIGRLRPAVLNVGARCVKVRIVGDDLALSADDPEQDALRGTALMRRQNALEARDLLHLGLEAEERR